MLFAIVRLAFSEIIIISLGPPPPVDSSWIKSEPAARPAHTRAAPAPAPSKPAPVPPGGKARPPPPRPGASGQMQQARVITHATF